VGRESRSRKKKTRTVSTWGGTKGAAYGKVEGVNPVPAGGLRGDWRVKDSQKAYKPRLERNEEGGGGIIGKEKPNQGEGFKLSKTAINTSLGTVEK